MGRSRFPPDEIKWLATSGIMVTSEPVRDKMVALTRSMSAATSSTSRSIEGFWGLSKGTITATPVSTFAQSALSLATIESAGWRGKGRKPHDPVDRRREGPAQRPKQENPRLRELVRTNDIVLVSAVGALLDGANIHHLVLDQNMSVMEGSLGLLPRRILVHEDDNREARQILSDAGLSHELRPDD